MSTGVSMNIFVKKVFVGNGLIRRRGRKGEVINPLIETYLAESLTTDL
jgi:hypothetical protein